MKNLLNSTVFFLLLAVYSPNSNAFLPLKKQFRNTKSQPPGDGVDVGKPLILSPYVHSGRFEEGRRLARNDLGGIESYSGYFTVHPLFNSNIFFWFFPAAVNPETAPVLVWLNGGPGASSLFGLFNENGPFRVDKNNNLHRRPYAWTQTHSVIYYDSPVGTGFSFTDTPVGYARTEDNVANFLYSATAQFFQLFPNFLARDFYITGESYAGKYAIAFAVEIYFKNPINSQKINLKGLAIGNGFSDPPNMFNWGTFLYNVGLIDEHQRQYFQQEEQKARNAIAAFDFNSCFEILDKLIVGDLYSYKTYFENATGFKDGYSYNILMSQVPDNQKYYISYVQQPSVRRALHVGNREFNDQNLKVVENLKEDFCQEVVHWIPSLLGDPNLRILFYSGNLDIIVPSISTEQMLLNIHWSGQANYRDAGNKIWRVGNDVRGYVREAKNLMYLLIRNAGHFVPTDQPKVAFDMINRFTSGKPFAR